MIHFGFFFLYIKVRISLPGNNNMINVSPGSILDAKLMG